jgi:hypothetical protein
MTSRSSIVKKTNTLLDEMIYIMFEYIVHLHDHQNKMVPLGSGYLDDEKDLNNLNLVS